MTESVALTAVDGEPGVPDGLKTISDRHRSKSMRGWSAANPRGLVLSSSPSMSKSFARSASTMPTSASPVASASTAPRNRAVCSVEWARKPPPNVSPCESSCT